jgi:hypothetical protein
VTLSRYTSVASEAQERRREALSKLRDSDVQSRSLGKQTPDISMDAQLLYKVSRIASLLAAGTVPTPVRNHDRTVGSIMDFAAYSLPRCGA